MLNALVLADGATKHFPFIGIAGRTSERSAPQSDCLTCDKDALGVQAMQDVVETLAFLPDAVFQRNAQSIDKHLVGVHTFAAELLDLTNLDFGPIKVGIEEAQAFCALTFLYCRGACQQQDLVGN